MTFALSPSEIDGLAATADRPLAVHMSTPFWREADAPNITEDRREALRFVGQVLRLGMYFHPSSVGQPYGKAGGIHSHEHLTEEQAKDLAGLAPEIKSPEIRALFADLSWLCIRGDPEIARLAVASYVESARNLEDPDQWTETIKRLERAMRLGRSLGANEPSLKLATEYATELVNKYRGEDKLFLTGHAIELLVEFDVGDLNVYVEYARRAAAGARSRNNFHVVRYYVGLLEMLHRKRKDADAVTDAQREIAKTFEAEARLHEATDENMVAAHFYNRAVQAYRRAPGSAEFVEAIRADLRRAERASITQLKKIQGDPIDISQYVLAARQHVSGHDLHSAILRLAHAAPLANPDEVRKTVVEIGKVAPLQRMLSAAILDNEGRTVGIAPGQSSHEDQNEAAIFAQIILHMTVQRSFNAQAVILPALEQVLLEHAITRPELIGLCTYSPFVPAGRERIFCEGLYAGFQSDFLSATHLLVPQIENSLRHLMDAQGMTVTKLDSNGVQRVLDLNELVVDDRIESILSKGMILELRALLTDNRGPNLRNQLAHGMLDDAEFMTAETVGAWWLVLALCVFSALVRAPTNGEGEKLSTA